MHLLSISSLYFFVNDTATTEIYTLSLHDALPISKGSATPATATVTDAPPTERRRLRSVSKPIRNNSSTTRSEEHTSELQSRQYLVCRLLLEKKKKKHK